MKVLQCGLSAHSDDIKIGIGATLLRLIAHLPEQARRPDKG